MPDSQSRDVGRQQEGFRLQKLRAVELILHSVMKATNAIVYCAIENEEDVNHNEVSSSGDKQYLEQDKLYDENSSFTFNNEHVLSTLANFIYCWSNKNFSNSVYFGFYATNRVGKERNTEKTKALGVTFPEKPIIELLQKAEYETANLTDSIQKLLINYIENLSNENPLKSTLPTINGFGNDEWNSFFSKISWRFGEEDVSSLKERLISAVKESNLYKSRSLVEREEILLSRLVDLFDERQSLKNPTERFVYGSDVRLAFLEVSTGESKVDDPTWKLWESIEMSDSRGLEEKLTAVCKDFSKSKLKSLSRKAAAGLLLHQEASTNKGILSARYRVYEACKEVLDDFIDKNAGKELSEDEVEDKIEEMVDSAHTKISELGKNFDYPVSNTESIREVMMELVDSCYLAFDSVEVNDDH